MTDGAPGQAAPGGTPPRHIPVLLREVIANLTPHDGGIYIDGTYGAGGYTAAILAAGDTRVVAIDRDPSAIAAGQGEVDKAAGRLTLVRGEFAALDRVADDLGIAAAMAWCSTSACPPCNSTPPNAASRSASTGRSTCAWAPPAGRQPR